MRAQEGVEAWREFAERKEQGKTDCVEEVRSLEHVVCVGW